MKRRSLLYNLVHYAWKVICQQFWLLAVLSVVICMFPLCVGPVAENLLRDGVDFSGITLAVCTPEDDHTGMILEELTSKMRDVSRYAKLESMGHQDAYQALNDGRVTAVLLLPEDFIDSILSGENPDVTVVVREDKPLDALLTLWVGQSAANLLTAAQKGIYAVLDTVDQDFPDGMSWNQIVMDINMVYITKSLNRQDFFQETELKPTGFMDIQTHYGFSLLIFLCLCLSPVFWSLLSGGDWAFRKRLNMVGCGIGLQLISCWIVMGAMILIITTIPILLISGWNICGILALTFFVCGYCTLCCILSRSVAECGCISLAGAAGLLYISGGIIPSPLIPQFVRSLDSLFPATKLREMLFLPCTDWDEGVALVFIWIFLLFLLSLCLFSDKIKREGEV